MSGTGVGSGTASSARPTVVRADDVRALLDHLDIAQAGSRLRVPEAVRGPVTIWQGDADELVATEVG